MPQHDSVGVSAVHSVTDSPGPPASPEPSTSSSTAAQSTTQAPAAAGPSAVQQPSQGPFSGLLWSPYDKEIAAVGLPALLGLMIEPLMNAFSTGASALRAHWAPRFSLRRVARPSPTRSRGCTWVE